MAHMLARPQFSLRTLLFVTAVVCLAAAAVAPLSPPPKPDGWGWEDLGFAIHAQALVRLSACTLFPAMVTAGIFSRHRPLRTFCIAAFPPMALPLILICFNAAITLMYAPVIRFNDSIKPFQAAAWGWKDRIAGLWMCAPCIGFSGLCFRWILALDDEAASSFRRNFLVRFVVVAVVALGSAAVMLKLEPDEHVSFLASLTIATALCLLLPALLGVVVVEGSGGFRAFSAGALLPALIPLFLLCDAGIRIMDWRYSIVTLWALMPVSGLACLFFYWLFQRGESGGQAVCDRR